MAFVKRKIQFQFQLGQGTFGDGSQTTTIDGLRCSVDIEEIGLGYAQCDGRIYGMDMETMNRLTTSLQFYIEQRQPNSVTILAGDDESGMSVVFKGTMFWAWCDARQQPDVAFWFSAQPGLFDASQTVQPVSFNGQVDVATVVQGIASQMGYGFTNNGVSSSVDSPYLPGTPKSQLEEICRAADCVFQVDEVNKMISIWPKGQAKDNQKIDVSPDTGLIGYPAFTQQGVQFSSLYNPELQFGRMASLNCDLTPANGDWLILKLSHSLEAEMPDGRWFTTCDAFYPGENYG